MWPFTFSTFICGLLFIFLTCLFRFLQVVSPSLVFYVLESGGTLRSYGMLLSVFSFSSFVFKPVLGYWVDKTGQFCGPYLASILVAALGGLVYFLASLFTGSVAIGLIFTGRLMGGRPQCVYVKALFLSTSYF